MVAAPSPSPALTYPRLHRHFGQGDVAVSQELVEEQRGSCGGQKGAVNGDACGEVRPNRPRAAYLPPAARCAASAAS